MPDTIPNIQEVNIKVGKMPLPCAMCGEVTAHDVTIRRFDAIIGTIDISYLCLGCNMGFTSRMSIVADFAKHDRVFRDIRLEKAAAGACI